MFARFCRAFTIREQTITQKCFCHPLTCKNSLKYFVSIAKLVSKACLIQSLFALTPRKTGSLNLYWPSKMHLFNNDNNKSPIGTDFCSRVGCIQDNSRVSNQCPVQPHWYLTGVSDMHNKALMIILCSVQVLDLLAAVLMKHLEKVSVSEKAFTQGQETMAVCLILASEYVWVQHRVWGQSSESYSKVKAAHTFHAYTLACEWLGGHKYLTTVLLT